MLRGLYAAASGMNFQMAQLNQIANNIANIGTNGFKRQELLASSFGDLVVQFADHAPGTDSTVGTGVKIDGVARFENEGSLHQTNNRFDFAIDGPGYFMIQGSNGVEKLTRDGAFQLDANHHLITQTGELVLNTHHRPITLNGDLTTMRVASNGDLYVDNKLQDQIMVTHPPEAALQAHFPVAPPGLLPMKDPVVRQGVLESSNVNVVTEMVAMVTANRAFSFDEKVVKANDNILQKAANDLGRMS